MPKLKTHRGAAKRFKKTKGGIKHRGAFRNHILTKKTKKQKLQLRSMRMLSKADEKSVEQMLAS